MHTKLHASLFEEGSSSSSSSSTNSDVLVINTSSSLNWSNGDIETVIIAMKQIARSLSILVRGTERGQWSICDDSDTLYSNWELSADARRKLRHMNNVRNRLAHDLGVDTLSCNSRNHFDSNYGDVLRELEDRIALHKIRMQVEYYE